MKKFDELASPEVVNKTEKMLKENGFLPEVVATSADAFARIKELIPAGASVMNGASQTLTQIGFVDYLKGGTHGWNNLHANILAETDKDKQALLRKQSVISDFYLGSAHAITEDGDLLIASNSGSQLPHLAFTSPNLILVVGTHKITADMMEAMARLKEYVFPLEDARMKSVGGSGSFISKILILNREQAFSGLKFHILLVNEKLGF